MVADKTRQNAILKMALQVSSEEELKQMGRRSLTDFLALISTSLEKQEKLTKEELSGLRSLAMSDLSFRSE